MTEQELAEYYDRLDKHDWFYHFSDDHKVVQAGERVEASLRGEAADDLQKNAIYEAFHSHKFKDADKPSRPTGPKPVRISDFAF